MIDNPYIAFEGPIAAGKTTHAKLLADRAQAAVILEDFAGNEFLADFYANRARWALPMQLWFLAARHRQMRAIPTPLSKPTVADYSWMKDQIFATILMNGRELRLFEQYADKFTVPITAPMLVVLVDAENEVLLERIRLRARPYEASIDTGYLNRLRDAYEDKFVRSGRYSLVRVNTTSLDLASDDQIRAVHNRIAAALSDGMNFIR